MKIAKTCLILSFLLVTLGGFITDEHRKGPIGTPGATSSELRWVDSIYKSMTLDERIGQLFMIRAHSDLGKEHEDEVRRQINEYKVGGLCFFQGTSEGHDRLIREYQQLSATPLMIAIDAEWGLGMRLKEDGISFPRQMTLGAIKDQKLIYQMGKEIGSQLSDLGIHVNFAPVADVNNNRDNPVIHTRSFGEDPLAVTERCNLYASGMQASGVMACLKHFPGHGDTDTDSHLDLPIITHSKERLDSIELLPFRAMSEQGIPSMMVAHLSLPSLDSISNLPATLSSRIIQDILREELQYNGLVFTDALEMKGVTKNHKPGQLEVDALMAGNDVLLLPLKIEESIKKIKESLDKKDLDEKRFAESVKKILLSKYRYGVFNKNERFIIKQNRNEESAIALNYKLYENAITLVKNKGEVLPLKEISGNKICALHLGVKQDKIFEEAAGFYSNIQHHYINNINAPSALEIVKRINKSNADYVLINLNLLDNKASNNFGYSKRLNSVLDRIDSTKVKVHIAYSSPYSLSNFGDEDVLVCAYENNSYTRSLVPQLVFGAKPFLGVLPVTINDEIKCNDGVQTEELYRLHYDHPINAELNPDSILLMDSIVNYAISEEIFPGCQVLLAKDGKIVFHKAYGHHNYDKKKAVQLDDFYDLASITKVAATTLSIMRMHEQGMLNVYNRLDHYLPELRKTNKGAMTIFDILRHQAGLKPWIPFYETTLIREKKNFKRSPVYYRTKKEKGFEIPVARDLYIMNTYQDSIWTKIVDSDLRTNKNYRYSDLGFYILKELIERISQQDFETYVSENLYQPLGLNSLRFNPWINLPIDRIVPSEKDDYFRTQEVRGYVHDMGAALLGGVSGHAGLFGTSKDLAILMQMLNNYGYYGGRRYFSYNTIREFTLRYGGSTRRGLGFDMKELNDEKRRSTSKFASHKTFGHFGFTGTVMWADPVENIVFVFLSNRTYPSMKNQKINEEQIRQRLHGVAYRAMMYK